MRAAINLMEIPSLDTTNSSTPHKSSEWFSKARFGMFVHYGLYSMYGKGEWYMYQKRLSPVDYNKAAQKFRAEKFEADKLVGIAKRARAEYVVFGARHHDGFCLWDTQTHDFNTVKTAAKRDLIREYVEACRRAGLRVGIYYSVMSWQWPAIFSGPVADPVGWEKMVAETHEQVRELMTNYGKIDYLWYDGCMVPGMGDASIRAKYWRSRKLNAMVRRLQPEILINDRAALAEDVTTPEQHLTAPPAGRTWECCQTIGQYWGWNKSPDQPKSVRTLLEQLIFCASRGGNFLLNVGPTADGVVPQEQVDRMEKIGEWLKVNGDAIRNSERTPYSEAQHLLGFATCRETSIYIHLTDWPQVHAVVAGIYDPIESIHILGEKGTLSYIHAEDGCVTIKGLPHEVMDEIRVIEIRLQSKPSHKFPPSLLVQKDTGRHLPAEAEVHPVSDWKMNKSQILNYYVPALGRYNLELGIISERAQNLRLSLDGKQKSESHVKCGKYPVTVRLGNLLLESGKHELQAEANVADFGIYLWRAQDRLQALEAKYWSVAGPYPTEFGSQGNVEQVKAALKKTFGPELGRDVQTGGDAEACRWKNGSGNDVVVNLSLLCDVEHPGVCFAKLAVISPDTRELAVQLGCDWWANLYVNGLLVRSERPAKEAAQDGAWFNGWKPIPARLPLNAGRNELLIKCHPGSTDNWFTFYVNNPGDICFEPGEKLDV